MLAMNNIINSSTNNLTSAQVKAALEEQFSRIFSQYLRGIVSENFPAVVDVESMHTAYSTIPFGWISYSERAQ
jgi:hypothetical protein